MNNENKGTDNSQNGDSNNETDDNENNEINSNKDGENENTEVVTPTNYLDISAIETNSELGIDLVLDLSMQLESASGVMIFSETDATMSELSSSETETSIDYPPANESKDESKLVTNEGTESLHHTTISTNDNSDGVGTNTQDPEFIMSLELASELNIGLDSLVEYETDVQGSLSLLQSLTLSNQGQPVELTSSSLSTDDMSGVTTDEKYKQTLAAGNQEHVEPSKNEKFQNFHILQKLVSQIMNSHSV